jgi:predicted dinucleotide-utilizing enzyme
MLRVGVIGCGTIGGEICQAIDNGLFEADLVGIHTRTAGSTCQPVPSPHWTR